MAAAKSWRMIFREEGDIGSFISVYLSEVALFDTLANNITPKIANVSSISVNSSFPAANVIDGNTATAWHTSELGPLWLRFDFANPEEVGSFTLRNFTSTALSPYWTDLQYMSDTGVWVTVSSHWRNTWAANETKAFTVPAPKIDSRYWAIQSLEGEYTLHVGGVALRESVGGVDLLQTATIMANSSAVSVSLLTDGNPSTSWFPRSLSHLFVMADCGTSKTVTVAEYTFTNSGAPSVLQVLSSEDGFDWAVNIVSIRAAPSTQISGTIALFLDAPPVSSAVVYASSVLVDTSGDAFGVVANVRPEYDYYRHGDGYISGVVTINGQPAERVVHLFDLEYSAVIRSVVSDPVTGTYDFRPIDRSRDYIVMSRDHKAIYNAVVADRVRPEKIQ